MSKKKNKKYKKYIFEFFSIFIAVISAFALSNWNESRQDNVSEEKILREIKNGISLDFKDFNGNKGGYKSGVQASKYFRDIIRNQEVNQDSLALYYTVLFRDFVPIINQSGYEFLKADGLKKVRNDSLRFQIITLYDYYYGILDKIEYEIDEMQGFTNYFEKINSILIPYFEYDNAGNLIGMSQPVDLSEIEKKEILSYLWRLQSNKEYKLKRYELIESKMLLLEEHIEKTITNIE